MIRENPGAPSTGNSPKSSLGSNARLPPPAGPAISGMFRSRNSLRSRMSDRWFQSGSEIVPSYLSVEVAPAFVVCRLEMKVSVGKNKNTPLADGHASWLNLRKQQPERRVRAGLRGTRCAKNEQRR